MPDTDKLLADIAARAPGFKGFRRPGPLYEPPDPDWRAGFETSAGKDLGAVDPSAGEDLAAAGSFSAPRSPRGPRYRADIAVLAALPSPELAEALSAFNIDWQEKIGLAGVVYRLARVELGGVTATVVAAAQNDMGMVPAAVLTTKTLQSWRPRLVAMVGVCAGVRSRVNLGDIIVARDVFDYGYGKLSAEGLTPDYQMEALNSALHNFGNDLASDATLLAEIRSTWGSRSAGRPDTELKAHVGAMGSGAAVVADEDVVIDVRQRKRSLVAIDMEAYGVMRAASLATPPPLAIVVKGVQDFAGPEPTPIKHQYSEYAAFVSAQFLKRFLVEHWKQIAYDDERPAEV